jgi:hypothetical protein
VQPDLVVEVQVVGWSGSGRVRHAVFLGLRADKPPREVIRDIVDPDAPRRTPKGRPAGEVAGMARMRKLIVTTQAQAERLAGKLARHRPGRKFTAYPIAPARFQVVEVHRWARLPTMLSAPLETLAALSPPQRPLPQAPHVATVVLPLKQESPAYLDVVVPGQVLHASFGKSSLVAWDIADGQVTMRVPQKYLVKRGFAHLAL